MLDDENYIRQFDVSDALSFASSEHNQAKFDYEILNQPSVAAGDIDNIIISSIGGSALSANFAKSWLKNDITVPIDIIRTYDIPGYINEKTLVIANSYSGNTEETISFLDQASKRGAKVAVAAIGGKLVQIAQDKTYPHVIVPSSDQPRMAVISQLCAITKILVGFRLVSDARMHEITDSADWLEGESLKWSIEKPIRENLAKKIAMRSAGKTAIFYGGSITAPVAYKFKISLNENAKNVAYWNELPEANHNEFIGWTSHPVEKPFAVFDIVSGLENPQILKRFEATDRLLSGFRPSSMTINLAGDTEIKQLLWGMILADFVGIYLAVLNGVDPTPVDLVNELKAELTK